MARCLYPITIGKTEGLKRHKVVPCGKCITCKRRRQSAWSFRLLQEMQHSRSAAFLTLTYDDDHLVYGDGRATLYKRDLQLFFKRLRKAQAKLTEDSIKYYSVGEYGSRTKRPHYHAIIFNVKPQLLFDGVLSGIWKAGHVRVDECNIKTIQYVTKYVMKSNHEEYDGVQPEFSAMSKGLGRQFLTDKVQNYYKSHEIPYLVWKDGQKITMPRYYKEIIWQDNPEVLRRFGKEALENVIPQELDSTKMFEIRQENLKLQRISKEKRNAI